MTYPHLFTPLAIGPIEIRNRIVLSAMTTGFGFDMGAPTEEMAAYVRARSRGVGLATVAFGAVRPEGRVEQQVPWMWRDDASTAMAPLAEAIHAEGALASLQLGHGGRQVSPKVTGEAPVAPSPIPPGVHVDVAPRELTTIEVEEVVASFGAAANRAAAAGFDAIELHGAHGYLVQQFLSAQSNRRNDRYGDDRARFGAEVIEAIRKGAPHLALIVRINGSDLVESGMTTAEAVTAAQRFVAAGAHAVLVSAGVYGSVPYTIPLLDDEEGVFLDLAAAVRASVSVPVIGVGRITLPDTAEEAIAEGKVDAIAVGRALLADPDWVAKASAGETADIRPCIATVQGCAGMLQHGHPISCAVNPEVGRESRPVAAPSEPRSVLVVGGGPAGMEAARRAAELGHQVTVLERSDRLGGQLRWAATTPPLAHLARLITWYERQLDRLRVEVRLETEARGDETADVVLVATGATVAVPPVAGFDLLPAWTLEGAMRGEPGTTGAAALPERVGIVGSGQRALAGALWLAANGHEVTLLSSGRLGEDTSGLTRRAFVARCDRAGVRRASGRIGELTDAGVVTTDGQVVPVDGLVLAEPLRPELPATPGERIGDAREPRDIAAAIAEGRQAAEAIATAAG